MCDLGLRIEGTVLQERVARLYDELAARKIRCRPHVWLSDEWFSPSGIPGIALPFYLAHPRLVQLERNQLHEVEGGTQDECIKILRHETGHAIDTAYRLHRRRRYRQVFGKHTDPYPESYEPKPFSKNYVLHLARWYAQSHPSEDFAETFAVWMKPRSRWRSQYEGWPVLKKLELVDELMEEVRNLPPKVRRREHLWPLRGFRITLRQHYERRREYYGFEESASDDGDLKRLFSSSPQHAHGLSAAAFLRRSRSELRRVVSHWTGQYQYTVDHVLDNMIERCSELDLRLSRSEQVVKRDTLIVLTVQTLNYIQAGYKRLVL